MALAAHMSEYIPNVICTGGEITEKPYMLSGMDAVRTISKYNTDIMFFSTGSVSEDGIIKSGSDMYFQLYECALKNAKKRCFLVDHTKVNIDLTYNIADFSQIDCVISDYHFSEDTKRRYKNTQFCEVSG